MFEEKTTAALKQQVLADICPATGLSALAGSFADAVAGPLCQQVSQFYQTLPAVLSMLFVDESSGRFLDWVGRDYHNLTRRAGTKARCAVALTGTPGTPIPAGTVFLTASGLRFHLLDAVTLGQDGTAVGQLEAAEVGEAYNIQPGALSHLWVNLPGLETYVNEQAAGGTDTESDKQLYQRIDEARKRPATSGNGWDYRRWALAVDGIGAAKVVELAEGPGTVGLLLVDSAYAPASPEMVEEVRAYLQERKPIGAALVLSVPEPLEISVSATVSIDRSVTTLDAVRRAFTERMAAYLSGLVEQHYGRICYGPEEDGPYTLAYNRVLVQLLTIPGVETFSTLTVHGGTVDVTLLPDQVPVLGEVAVI